MRKQLTMTTGMAAALIALPGCSSNDGWNEEVVADQDVAVCVDAQGQRIDDDFCDNDRYYSGGGGYYSRYYLRRGAPVPYYGDSINDPRYAAFGSTTPIAGASYGRAPVATSMTRSQAVSRGGMGSSGSFFGGGRS